MALLGFSLIIASFVLFCMRRPGWFPSIFGGPPRPPIGAPPEDDPETESKPADDRPSTADTITRNGQPGNHDSNLASGRAVPAQRQPAAQIPMPPPPVIQLAASEPSSAALGPPSVDSACDDSQTTPKASAATLTTPHLQAAPSRISIHPDAPPPRPPTLRPPPTGAASARSSSRTPHPRPGPTATARLLDPRPAAHPQRQTRQALARRGAHPGHSPLDWARLSDHPTADLRGPAGHPLRVTPSMLKKMTGRRGKDAWTAMGGRVYNISPYLPFHPGGEAELLRGAGPRRDAVWGGASVGELRGHVGGVLVGIYVPEEEGGEAKGAGGGGGAAAAGDMEAMD
ncbi:hypothetical protein NEMBOFW57_010421 [Staphylotrichum longicolle]|uniref:Cytochrome b5 heme-binding domain-containing protein n=1 Tax=Staphylotrichum longicolle TaxID=669026 RepID=A0AAD4EN13_9PEZI|nr:hypothetical protein NEMBOFW57_010421 [Staphylotrichum longicolle]